MWGKAPVLHSMTMVGEGRRWWCCATLCCLSTLEPGDKDVSLMSFQIPQWMEKYPEGVPWVVSTALRCCWLHCVQGKKLLLMPICCPCPFDVPWRQGLGGVVQWGDSQESLLSPPQGLALTCPDKWVPFLNCSLDFGFSWKADGACVTEDNSLSWLLLS